MWLTVLAGAAVEAREKGSEGLQQHQQQQKIREAEVQEALLTWAVVRPGVDQAQVCGCGWGWGFVRMQCVCMWMPACVCVLLVQCYVCCICGCGRGCGHVFLLELCD